MTTVFQNQSGVFTTSVEQNENSKVYVFTQKMNIETDTEVICFTEKQAIKMALAILQNSGTISTTTTIGDLEKSGILPTCY